MAEGSSNKPQTLGLKTRVEEDFVLPLTAIKGVLELLRDFPDIDNERRGGFVASALHECERLERGVAQLAESVYDAGRRSGTAVEQADSGLDADEYARRVHVLEDHDVIEIDFTDFQFTDSEVVNAMYDVIERMVQRTSRKWYFIVNHTNCRVWPEAWVAFAHRGKKINFVFSLGTIQFGTGRAASGQQSINRNSGGVEVLEVATREDALKMIDELRSR